MAVHAYRPSCGKNIEAFNIIYEMNNMGHSGIDTVDNNLVAVYRDSVFHYQAMRGAQAYFYTVRFNLGVDDSCQRLERHALLGDLPQKGETGGAAAPVAAHLRLGAVGVEKAPAEIDFVGWFDDDQAIRSYRNLASADAFCERSQVSYPKREVHIVNKNEIIAASAEFVELNHRYTPLYATEILHDHKKRLRDLWRESFPALYHRRIIKQDKFFSSANECADQFVSVSVTG
jgi:hypothetical protein